MWFISHFSARIIVCILGVIDAFGMFVFYCEGSLIPYVKSHIPLLISIVCVTILISLLLSFLGGKAGYDYRDMGRSRRWEYVHTDFSRGDNTFLNVIYWACKFALFPVIAMLVILLIIEVIYIFPLLN